MFKIGSRIIILNQIHLVKWDSTSENECEKCPFILSVQRGLNERIDTLVDVAGPNMFQCLKTLQHKTPLSWPDQLIGEMGELSVTSTHQKPSELS